MPGQIRPLIFRMVWQLLALLKQLPGSNGKVSHSLQGEKNDITFTWILTGNRKE